MLQLQSHRGPDGLGVYFSQPENCALGHNRLSIIDLSDAANQPMASNDGNLVVVLNGEIYNYVELRAELAGCYTFRTHSDTEVLLAAYQKWGSQCLKRLHGMFAFVIWNRSEQMAFAARDRFGVKPLYYHETNDGSLLFSSEIKALHGAGIPRIANDAAWASYLAFGLYDHYESSFWQAIYALSPGHSMTWKQGKKTISKWYDVAEHAGCAFDARSEVEVQDEYFALMKESVSLRFRSDVPVGINLSGGLDSSTLLGLVQEVQGIDSDVKAFTFTTGDERYDELPWVEQMLGSTKHPLVVSRLSPDEVPALAESVQFYQDEPYGGLPTLAYAKLFETAKAHGVTVLLDGNGMDEQWAGYDYYAAGNNGKMPGLVQGTSESPVRPECLLPDFRDLARPLELPTVFHDKMRNLQYRDARFTKMPRAMRFNDRVSMRSSRELREPFLDHRLFELAMRQPPERKIADGVHKKMLREIGKRFLPSLVVEAPKRPMQTPQREWLRGPLREWAEAQIEKGLAGGTGAYVNPKLVRGSVERFMKGESDNSFYIWQWISMGMMCTAVPRAVEAA